MSKFLSLAGSLAGSAIAIALMSPFLIGPIKSFVKGPDEFKTLTLVSQDQAERLQGLVRPTSGRAAEFFALEQELNELIVKIEQEGLTIESARKLSNLKKRYEELLNGTSALGKGAKPTLNGKALEKALEERVERSQQAETGQPAQSSQVTQVAEKASGVNPAPRTQVATTEVAGSQTASKQEPTGQTVANQPAANQPVPTPAPAQAQVQTTTTDVAKVTKVEKTVTVNGTTVNVETTVVTQGKTPAATQGQTVSSAQQASTSTVVTELTNLPAGALQERGRFTLEASEDQFTEFFRVLNQEPLEASQPSEAVSAPDQFYLKVLAPDVFAELNKRANQQLTAFVTRLRGIQDLAKQSQALTFYVINKDKFTDSQKKHRAYFEGQLDALANLVVSNLYTGVQGKADNKIYLQDQVKTCLSSGWSLNQCVNDLAYAFYNHHRQVNLNNYQKKVGDHWGKFSAYVDRNAKTKIFNAEPFTKSLVVNLHQLQLAMRVLGEVNQQHLALEQQEVTEPVDKSAKVYADLETCLSLDSLQDLLSAYEEERKNIVGKDANRRKVAPESRKSDLDVEKTNFFEAARKLGFTVSKLNKAEPKNFVNDVSKKVRLNCKTVLDGYKI